MVHSPNRIVIDLSAIENNLNQVKKLLAPETRIMGVVKSDAYGHGLVPVSRVLERSGVDYLGVAHLYEALELRKNGIELPIVLLCGVRAAEEAREAVEKDLTPVLFDLAMAELLAKESVKKGRAISVQVKVDTGMGRLGITLSDLEPFLKTMAGFKGLFLEALASHLSSADEPESDFTEIQIENFNKAIDIGRSMGFELPLNNLANSAGIMSHKEAHFSLVRPGIMLYGGLPSPNFKTSLSLKPAMHFKGEVVQTRDLADNTPVSYGRTYYTKGKQKIAVLSAGYGDGLPRNLSNKGKVLMQGKRVDVVGTVCMNMIMCDVSGLRDIVPGSEVVFLGTQGEETITGDDIATWTQTISYEIFCSIGVGTRKEYVG
ncbi:MAG: alanine racemase [Desulfobacteraceae bacterium]|jgi:alanine racemase